MSLLTSNVQLMMEQSSRFLWNKQTAILDNISNVETPGYKTKYVTFEEALKKSIQSAAGSGTPAASIKSALTQAASTTHEDSNESTRMDGNSVNITEQGVELTRNSFQLQYAMNAINGDLGILRTAIKGQ